MFLITLWEIWVPPWAAEQGLSFNWWRCWESTGGGAIGFGFGIVFVINNKKLKEDDPNQRIQRYSKSPNKERLFGVYLSLCFGLVYSINSSIKGNLHIRYPHIPEFDNTQLGWLLPLVVGSIICWCVLLYYTSKQPYLPNDNRDNVPKFGAIYIGIYILMRELGLQVTYAPEYNFSEIMFLVFYIILGVLDLSLIWIYLHKNGLSIWKEIKSVLKSFSNVK